jgi:DNA-binding MarR family transcriptional regulator
VRAQQTALLKLERALREAGLPPYIWYDALWELDQAGDAGLRPAEIQRQMLIAQSNISRLIDRLEEAGCVARRSADDDGRAQLVVITENGRLLRKRMWPVYATSINATIGTAISDREAIQLGFVLDKVVPQNG